MDNLKRCNIITGKVNLTFAVVLQMSDDDPNVIPEMDPTLRKQIQQCNLQVVNVTTPANYFHVLRRQVSGFVKSLNHFVSKEVPLLLTYFMILPTP